VHAKSPGRALHGIVSATFSDPTNERLIYMSAIGLLIVGVALLVGTLLWWRRGRQEHPVLAPLEVMSTRTWEKAPEGERRRLLNSVRINGELVSDAEVVRSEPVDLQALVRSVPQAFDDLREPGVAGEAAVVPADEAPHHFEVSASGDVELVDESAERAVWDAAEPAEPAADDVVAEPAEGAVAEPVAEEAVEEPAPVDVDATTFSAERPKKPVETLAAVPTEPSR